MSSGTYLSSFTGQLVDFMKNLTETIPEEKSIKMGYEMLLMTKKINPRLILDLFDEHIAGPLSEAINQRNLEYIQAYARAKAESEHNEILPAIAVFDKYWTTLSPSSQDSIWKYMKVLCILAKKAKD
jgi:hypothetical protein